ncbi:FixH family protein [Heyndrickxia acidicola]|uniref:FixH family protein n=1 Tax=Heyndrickxia acidicola TaxID=209389 RepID=A0ABU6MCQ4_9BACI|nr:FixH family protein [Heyndrickxia acidicola]MED1202450.1 FixH family protein [Heyndrickxia acidicola]
MKKIVFLSILAVMMAVTSACSTSNSSSELTKTMPEPIAVTLKVQSKASVNQEIPLKSIVKQGKDMVKDADEVMYETWKENQKDKDSMLDAKNEKDGTYTATVKFDQPGVYYVQVHVTARSMHDMPKTKIVIRK